MLLIAAALAALAARAGAVTYMPYGAEPTAPGDWVEFTVERRPGTSIRNAATGTVEKGGGVPAALMVPATAGTAATSRIQLHGIAVPLRGPAAALAASQPPALVQSPQVTARRRPDAMLLNSRSPPPTVLTPTQVPSALL